MPPVTGAIGRRLQLPLEGNSRQGDGPPPKSAGVTFTSSAPLMFSPSRA